MMALSLLTFAGIMALLIAEGVLILQLCGGPLPRGLAGSLALSAGAVGNVLLFFLYTLLHIPLALLTVVGGHILIIVLLWILTRRLPRSGGITHRDPPQESWTAGKKLLVTICTILLMNTAAFSAVHALILPSISIDVFTNWAMRSEVSWNDGAMAFDTTEARGVAKPQYPFLVHSLQIAANAGQRQWSDRAANTALWMLTMSALLGAFFLLQRGRGTLIAVVTLTAITQIPLLSIHLSAGYGDMQLAAYGLLGFLALVVGIEERSGRWLAVSSLLVLGAMWSKSEGLYFVLVPWALTLLLLARSRAFSRRSTILSMLIPLLCFLPFLALLTQKGLPLTPHETDSAFGLKLAGLLVLPRSLWSGGSLGILWYALPVAILALLRRRPLRPSVLPLLAFGVLSFLGVLAVYLLTPNVDFLLNSQSFYRQLLLPAALLVAWCGASFVRHGTVEETQ